MSQCCISSEFNTVVELKTSFGLCNNQKLSFAKLLCKLHIILCPVAKILHVSHMNNIRFPMSCDDCMPCRMKGVVEKTFGIFVFVHYFIHFDGNQQEAVSLWDCSKNLTDVVHLQWRMALLLVCFLQRSKARLELPKRLERKQSTVTKILLLSLFINTDGVCLYTLSYWEQ